MEEVAAGGDEGDAVASGFFGVGGGELSAGCIRLGCTFFQFGYGAYAALSAELSSKLVVAARFCSCARDIAARLQRTRRRLLKRIFAELSRRASIKHKEQASIVD